MACKLISARKAEGGLRKARSAEVRKLKIDQCAVQCKSNEWTVQNDSYMLKLYFKIKILSNALKVISSTSLTSIKRRKRERASLHWPTTASKSTTTTAATKYLLLHLQHWPTKSRFAPLSLNLRSKTSPPWKNWATSSFTSLFISSGQSVAIYFLYSLKNTFFISDSIIWYWERVAMSHSSLFLSTESLLRYRFYRKQWNSAGRGKWVRDRKDKTDKCEKCDFKTI